MQASAGESKTAAIAQICNLLSDGNDDAATRLVWTACSNEPVANPASASAGGANPPPGRSDGKYSDVKKTRLFLRDGFTDRYTGDRLVFPGVLRLLSLKFPQEFPYHPNWKYGECHSWYWELYPTVDHVDSVGADNEENWVTTSMMRNLKKSNIPLRNHGWTVRAPPRTSEWDGLLRWYIRFVASNRELLNVRALKQWYTAATKALAGAG